MIKNKGFTMSANEAKMRELNALINDKANEIKRSAAEVRECARKHKESKKKN